MSRKKKLATKDVEAFERLKQQLIQLHRDISTLSKKSPDGPINKFKLGVINEKLAATNGLLTESFMPIKSFTLFDDVDLPSNSDIVLVLSQYLEALEVWRSSNLVYVDRSWYWDTEEETHIRADLPDKNYRASRKQ